GCIVVAKATRKKDLFSPLVQKKRKMEPLELLKLWTERRRSLLCLIWWLCCMIIWGNRTPEMQKRVRICKAEGTLWEMDEAKG
ncbi:hypothetical protein CHARACLAT_030941, partial [Characodon lateralis]|nr:hypothetical protein [Characodon lateralis]